MISKQMHSRKIYYPAGLISIVLLPVLCIWYLNENKAFEKLRTIELTWWSPNIHFSNSFLFPKESHPKRNYTDVDFTGIYKEDKVELIKAQLLIRELITSKNPSTGVHFHFADESKYSTFIKVLDICKIEKATHYIPYENDIWVINPAFENCVNVELSHCGGIYNTIDISEDLDKKMEVERTIQKNYILKTTKKYSIPIILFIIMTFLTAKNIYKRNKVFNY